MEIKETRLLGGKRIECIEGARALLDMLNLRHLQVTQVKMPVGRWKWERSLGVKPGLTIGTLDHQHGGSADLLGWVKSVIRARRKVGQTQKLEEYQRTRNGYCVCLRRVGNNGHLERVVRDMELEIFYGCL